jgi:type II secretion system protein G
MKMIKHISFMIFLCLIPQLTFASEKVIAVEFEIKNLELALYRFGTDCHRLPTTDEGLQVLLKAPSNTPSWRGPYLKKLIIPKDYWGENFIYYYPSRHSPERFDLYSKGKNNIDEQGDGDDVSQWKDYDKSKYHSYDFTAESLLLIIISAILISDFPIAVAVYFFIKVRRGLRQKKYKARPTTAL